MGGKNRKRRGIEVPVQEESYTATIDPLQQLIMEFPHIPTVWTTKEIDEVVRPKQEEWYGRLLNLKYPK